MSFAEPQNGIEALTSSVRARDGATIGRPTPSEMALRPLAVDDVFKVGAVLGAF